MLPHARGPPSRPTRDPTFGPVVALGAGGILAEHLDDVTFLCAPVTPEAAAAALRSLRIGRVLDGLRGRVHDLAAAAELVARVSEVIAACDWIAGIDLDPELVRPIGGSAGPGAVAVDAVVGTTSDAGRKR